MSKIFYYFYKKFFMNNNKSEIIICECCSVEHQLIFRTIHNPPDMQNDEVFIDIHLNKKPFWKRLKHGLKYIFGYECRFGAFDEIITTKEKLQNIINKL